MLRGLIVAIVLLLAVFGALAIFWISTIDYSDSMPALHLQDRQGVVFLDSLSEGIEDIEQITFSFGEYLKERQYLTLGTIRRDYEMMIRAIPDQEQFVLETLFVSLSDSLYGRLKPQLEEYHPDELIRLIEWAALLKQGIGSGGSCGTLFEVLHYYWMVKGVELLELYSLENPSRKFDYKFRFAQKRCEQYDFIADIGNSKFEKLIYRLSEGRWSYILNRLLNHTTWYQMLIIVLSLLVFMYGSFRIFAHHFIK